MKHILVLGAGQSAPYLINFLLENAPQYDWFVTIGDRDLAQAQKALKNHPHGAAVQFDINDAALRSTLFEKVDIVVNMLSPVFQYLIALECLNHNAHVISASYQSKEVEDLNLDAHRKGLLILNEMGLDPGIDHMSAMKLIHRVQKQGGIITSFLSYGSGVPAPEVRSNPLRYCITWNPRNVVRAGEAGAQYMEDGKIRLLSHNTVFTRTWMVEVEGVGMLEAYANRNSLVYKEIFGIDSVRTMVRGTLRYPGWSETWHQIVRLGLPNDTMPIPGLKEMAYREFLEMFLPIHISGLKLEQRVANYLNISPTGKIMENLRWLGLFSNEKIGGEVSTAADVMINLLMKKLPLPAGGQDMVIIQHEIEAQYPGKNNHSERILSTLIEYGEPGGFTAMAKTVGMPVALAVKMALTGQLPLTGCQLPTHAAIYEPVLEELSKAGLSFREKTLPLEKGA